MKRSTIEEAARQHLPQDVADLYLSQMCDAVSLARHDTSDSRSYCGGRPVVDNIDWPTWHNRPLDFIAAIDLADLAELKTGRVLPPAGSLSFFYASGFDDQPWGIDLADQGGWRVIYTAPGTGHVTTAPEGSTVFDRYDLVMEQTVSIPHLNSSAVRGIWEQHPEALITFWDSLFDDYGSHQVGGWPSLQQASFWADGHYGLLGVPARERRHDDASLEAIQDELDDWQLLFQFVSDFQAGYEWADGGTLFFAIRKQDLAALRFDRCWLTLQC